MQILLPFIIVIMFSAPYHLIIINIIILTRKFQNKTMFLVSWSYLFIVINILFYQAIQRPRAENIIIIIKKIVYIYICINMYQYNKPHSNSRKCFMLLSFKKKKKINFWISWIIFIFNNECELEPKIMWWLFLCLDVYKTLWIFLLSSD